MPDRIITAEALITAKDGTGDVFTQIARKISEVGKSAKASANVEALAQSIGRAEAQLKAISKLDLARSSFGQSRTRFNEAQKAVESWGKAVGATTTPTKAMMASYSQAQAAVKRANVDFEKQKTVLLDVKRAVEGFGIPIRDVSSAQMRLRSSIEGTTRAIEHQIAAERKAAEMAPAIERAARQRERIHERMSRMGAGHMIAGAAAGYVSAHGVVSGIEETYKAGADYQHQIVGLQNAGRTPAEIAEIQKRSAEVVSRVPTATFTENLKVIAETTQAFGSVEHAMEHLEFMQKAMSVLGAAGDAAEGGPKKVGQDMAKWFEERMRPAGDFEKDASSMIPAMVASGGKFNPAELYAFAQQAKSAMPSYNDRFMSKIAPSLITANGGERAGTAAAAFDNVITGKARDKKQAAEWARLELLDPKDVIGGKDGPIGWKAGAVKGTNLAGQDPLEWAEKVLIPAMKAKGINVDDRQSVKNELATLFRNQNANFFANEIVQAQSRSRLHKDEGLYNAVGSTEEIYKRNLAADPSVALTATKSAFENLITTVSQPGMGKIAEVLTGVAKGLDSVALWAKDHPDIAMTVGAGGAAAALAGSGYLSYQMMNGFGLGASATALDGSAVALTEAAVALGAKSVLPKIPLAVPALALPELALPSLVAGGAGAAFLGGAIYLAKKAFEANEPGKGGPYSAPTLPTADLDRDRLAGMKQELADVQAQIAATIGKSKLGPEFPSPTLQPMQDRAKELQNQIDLLSKAISGLSQPGVGLPKISAADAAVALDGGRHKRHPNITWIEGEPNDAPASADLPPSTMRPADAVDRASERQKGIDDLEEKQRESVWQFGQLNTKTGIVLTSFDTLGGASGTLGGTLGGLAQAAALATEKLSALASFGGGGGGGTGSASGGGILKASYETSGGAAAWGAGSFSGSVGDGSAVDRALGMQGAREGQAARALGHIMHAGEWCADFANGIIEKSGGRGSGKATAKSFMNWGKAVGLADIKKGDIAVLNHGGHVGFFTGERQGNRFGVVAGNTRDGHGGHDVRHYFVNPGSIYGARRGAISEDRIEPRGGAGGGVTNPRLEGQAHVRIKIDSEGRVVDSHASSRGHIKASVGNTDPPPLSI